MEYLWTPWRSTYINEKKRLRDCIFCTAAAADADSENLLVYRCKLAFVIPNRYPYTAGHVKIAPYEHVSGLCAASEAATEEIMLLARRAETILNAVYRPGGLNLGMNLGEAAGAGIEHHIHLHVLPRWTGDANFMTTVGATRVLPEDLNETYRKLSRAFQER